jgi:hypothetical protein
VYRPAPSAIAGPQPQPIVQAAVIPRVVFPLTVQPMRGNRTVQRAKEEATLPSVLPPAPWPPEESLLIPPPQLPSNLPPLPFEVSGHAVPSQSGEHHPRVSFDFGGWGESESYELDPWISSKAAPIDLTAFPADPRPRILVCVQGWQFNRSIIDDLVDVLLATKPVLSWNQAEIQEALADDARNRRVVKHLLSLKASVNQRVADIPRNMPTKIQLKFQGKGKAKAPETITINWMTVLAEGRRRVKDMLLQGTACPKPRQGKPPAEGVTIVTDALLAVNDPGLAALKKYGILLEGEYQSPGYYKEGLKYTVSATVLEPGPIKKEGGKTVKPDFSFGLNHLRFILYLEWRAVSELLNL